jgi:hypothetical protein
MMMEKVDDTQDTNCHLGHGYKFQVHVLVEGTQRTTMSISNSSPDDGDEIGREPEK